MLKDDKSTFTGNENAEKEEVNLEDIKLIHDKFWNKVVLGFIGVPVKIDESLRNFEYHIAVSPELYDRIEEEQMRRIDNVKT